MKPIDMSATINKVFEEAYDYADKISAMYVEPEAKEIIQKGKMDIKGIQNEIVALADVRGDRAAREKIADNVFYKYVCHDANYIYCFVKPGSNNYLTYHAFKQLMKAVCDYYATDVFTRKFDPVLEKLKTWKYRTSKSAFKDFYPFMPLRYFAEKVK